MPSVRRVRSLWILLLARILLRCYLAPFAVESQEESATEREEREREDGRICFMILFDPLYGVIVVVVVVPSAPAA